MRRGFKAEAERLSIKLREDMGLDAIAPIDPWACAESAGVIVLKFESLGLDQKDVHQLIRVDPGGWSGLTLKDEGRHFIVINPADSRARQCNTMMHELAHIQLKHIPKSVALSDSGLMLLSDYPADQEEEADWLAAATLLPRDALHYYRTLGWTSGQIGEHYCVSGQLCDWRLRMTGVEMQLRRRSSA